MKEVTEIRLPEGTFFGNCRDCRYADRMVDTADITIRQTETDVFTGRKTK